MTKPATVYCSRLLRGPLACTLLCSAAVWAAQPAATLEVSSDAIAPPQAHAPLRVDATQWLPAGSSSSLGFSLGGMRSAQAEGAGAHPQLNTAWEPTVGVHWRSQLSGSTRLEIGTWARAPYASRTPDAQSMIWMNSPSPYGARLELQWAAPRLGGLLPEFGAVGLQLEGNSQLLLRSRAGGPMLYYRSKF